MIGVVIVAHGGLAREYLAAVEHVVGRQPGVRAIAIGPEDDRAMKQAEICDAADAVDEGDGVVVVTDMFGGSPSNLSLRACGLSDRRILYGANLPMLIKLAKSRRKAVGDAVAAALEAGRKYIDAQIVPSDVAEAPVTDCAGPPSARPVVAHPVVAHPAVAHPATHPATRAAGGR